VSQGFVVILCHNKRLLLVSEEEYHELLYHSSFASLLVVGNSLRRLCILSPEIVIYIESRCRKGRPQMTWKPLLHKDIQEFVRGAGSWQLEWNWWGAKGIGMAADLSWLKEVSS